LALTAPGVGNDDDIPVAIVARNVPSLFAVVFSLIQQTIGESVSEDCLGLFEGEFVFGSVGSGFGQPPGKKFVLVKIILCHDY